MDETHSVSAVLSILSSPPHQQPVTTIPGSNALCTLIHSTGKGRLFIHLVYLCVGLLCLILRQDLSKSSTSNLSYIYIYTHMHT